MDFSLTAEDTAFRNEVEEFLKRELPGAKDIDTGGGWGLIDWRGEEGKRLQKDFVRKVAQRKWNIAGWPKEHGGLELDFVKRAIIKDVMAYYRAPSGGPGPELIAPIIMTYGTDDQKSYHLPLIASAEVRWCQFFSEPDAGSDLANTQVTAVADGDDFIVNGVKVWHDVGTEWGAAMVRTDPQAPKHRGISFLLIRCDSPGLTIEPLVDLAGGIVIGKSTFDNVHVPRANLVGELNRGWYVAMSVMNLERSAVAGPASARRALDDFMRWARTTNRNGQRIIDEPITRHKLAQTHIEIEVGRTMAYRIAALMNVGYAPDTEASITKMYASELQQRVARTTTEIMGLHSLLEPQSKHAELNGFYGPEYLRTTVGTVALGTSEIMRNMVATRGLGLPRG